MMKKIKLLIVTTVLSCCSAWSAPLQLTDEPLFLNQSVPPALAVTFDDSGSMAWSWMPDSRSFDRNRRSFASPDYNLMYYNPNIIYEPPVKADGTSLPNSDFNNASRDGYYTSGDFLDRKDLRSEYKVFRYYRPDYDDGPGEYSISYAKSGRSDNENRAFYYRWVGPADASEDERKNRNDLYQRVDIVGAEQEQNFANWYTYYNTRAKLARAAVSHAFVNFGPDFKVDWQQINNHRFANKTTNMKTFDGSHRQDFYDWLFLVPSNGSTPLRRATKDVGDLFSEGGVNSPYYDSTYGQEFTCQQNFHIAISDGSWNSSAGVTDNKDNLPMTLPPMANGDTYSYNPSNSMYSDSNAGTLADTAFWYWARDLRPDLDNNVPQLIQDYTDKNGNVVNVPSNQQWYESSELFWNPKNNPASWQHVVNFNVGLGIEGSFDRNTDLPDLRRGNKSWPDTNEDSCFMLTSIGAEVEVQCATHVCYDSLDNSGNVVNCNERMWPIGPIRHCENLTTGDPLNCSQRIVRYVKREAGRVDDVWHSSLNSRGDYFSAKNPQELSTALNDVVSDIIKRKGRSSAGSVSSNIISSESLTYKTGYDTSDWSGFVTAEEHGGDIVWDAGCKLTGGYCSSMQEVVSASNDFQTREIITYDKASESQVEFKATDLTSDQMDLILDSNFYQDNIEPLSAINEGDIIDYIRGERQNEQSEGGPFRTRRNLLGDVIHSPAVVIRGPGAFYNDNYWSAGSPERIAADSGNGYKEFRDTNKNRESIILVGSNDGMLHAFDSGLNSGNGGHEYWAYIPSKSLDGLSDLANPAYAHRSFVDASPTVKDAFINDSWETIALGGMRKGGKLFYALNLNDDLTSTPDVMWEFTDADDPDLGFSYAGAVIARVAAPDGPNSVDTKWVAIVPNGYNSANHKAVMYALDLETGNILHKWDTGNGSYANPNGMGPPTAADFIVYDPNDTSNKIYGSDQATDYVYAGDLYGNLYRFDMKDIFTGFSSAPELLYAGSDDQPITTAPRVFTPGNNEESVIVVFGTGKYIESSDRSISNTPPQYLFGLKNNSEDISTPYELDDSRIVEQYISQSGETRSVTSSGVQSNQSWKLQLPQQGERMVNAIARDNNQKTFAVATIIPNGTDPCLSGGQSWLMMLDARTGGAPKNGSFFRDGTADGIFVNDLILGFNTLTSIGGNQQFINIDTAGGNNTVITEEIPTNKWKRRSWRRIQIGQ